MKNNATHDASGEPPAISAATPAIPRTPLPPHVMAGIAKVMIGEALDPEGIHVSLDEATRWLDVLHSTTPPVTP